jgi:hypothetical protein
MFLYVKQKRLFNTATVVNPDPLEAENFWPCPELLLGSGFGSRSEMVILCSVYPEINTYGIRHQVRRHGPTCRQGHLRVRLKLNIIEVADYFSSFLAKHL